ncbi:MAG: hypothetical protein NTX87_03755 [Planctomycetota bacterium]|nr:hypothetical protein [Planctomycetota bacterium]
MVEILAEFSRLLRVRFGKKAPTSEDAIRYTFFYAITSKGNVQPHEIVLESPHHRVEGAHIDTIVLDFRGKCWAMEFKFHRKAPGAGTATPHSLNAGELFSDISRLAAFQGQGSTERLLVYVTDSVMAGYFRSPPNGFVPFLDLLGGQRFRIDGTFIDGKCKTFRKAVGEKFEAEVTCLFSANLLNGYELRVYNILPQLPRVQAAAGAHNTGA